MEEELLTGINLIRGTGVLGLSVLYRHLDKKISLVHTNERQVGPDNTGQHRQLFGAYFLSCGVLMLSLALMIAYAAETLLLVGLVYALLYICRLDERLGAVLGTAGRWLISGAGRSQAIRPLFMGGFVVVGLLADLSTKLYHALSHVFSDGFTIQLAQLHMDTLQELSLFVGVCLTLLATALWQSYQEFMWQANSRTASAKAPYSLRSDTQLLALLMLLTLFLTLAGVIAYSPIPGWIFWSACGLASLIRLLPAGRRLSRTTLGAVRSSISWLTRVPVK